MTTTLTVTSVPATSVHGACVQITVRTRATKDKETGQQKVIAPGQRSRSVIIPEWQPNVSSKYVSLVCSALHATAQAVLSEAWDNDPSLSSISASLFTEDSLLLWSARKSEARKLSAESIRDWFQSSALHASMATQYSAVQIARFILELEHLASPVISARFYSEEKAVRRIATLATHDADTEHEVCQQLIGRLQRYIDAIRKERESIGSVEELDC